MIKLLATSLGLNVIIFDHSTKSKMRQQK